MISVVIERAGQIDQEVFNASEIIVGRGGVGSSVDLDLASDTTVSRRHLRVAERDGLVFVEDLGSTLGTLINGVRISAVEQVFESDKVQLGENVMHLRYEDGAASTKVKVKNSEGIMVTSYYVYREKKYRYTTSLSSATDEPYSEFEGKSPSIYGRIEVSDEIALGEVFSGDEDVPDLSKRYIKMLMDAPRRFSVQKDLNRQLIEIVGRLVEQMEGVERSAVLLVDDASGFLDLRAHYPENEPAVSGTLAVRALTEKKGFIWQKSALDNASDSIRQMRINSGMYAPLICGEHHLGVLCVDTTRRDHVFKRLDLHFFLAFTQIIAACVQSKVIHETVSVNLQGIQEALKDAEKSGATQLIRTVQNYAKFLQDKIAGSQDGGEKVD
tara:strand:- start:421 stop:1572 length:1152 start_codon:yes stop_codon:yes gene_type:complete